MKRAHGLVLGIGVIVCAALVAVAVTKSRPHRGDAAGVTPQIVQRPVMDPAAADTATIQSAPGPASAPSAIAVVPTAAEIEPQASSPANEDAKATERELLTATQFRGQRAFAILNSDEFDDLQAALATQEEDDAGAAELSRLFREQVASELGGKGEILSLRCGTRVCAAELLLQVGGGELLTNRGGVAVSFPAPNQRSRMRMIFPIDPAITGLAPVDRNDSRVQR